MCRFYQHKISFQWHSNTRRSANETIQRNFSDGAPTNTNNNEDDGDEKPLILSQKDGVLTLTLNRPKQRNALNLALLQDLRSTLMQLKQQQRHNDDGNGNGDGEVNRYDRDIRAVIIQANGPAFCSGHDLKELILSNHHTNSSTSTTTTTTYSTTETQNTQQIFHICSEVMTLLRTIPQPTIAAIHGIATAAGCQLAASTDLTIASDNASFATPGVDIGLFCSTPAVPLLRILPRKIANDMLFTGRVLCANEALRYGLVSRVIHSYEDDEDHKHGGGDTRVKEEASAIARLIASKSAHAVQMGKETLYEQVESVTMEEAYGIATSAMVRGMESDDAIYGIESFLKKERPIWNQKHR